MSSIDVLSPKGEGRLFSKQYYSTNEVGAGYTGRPPLPSSSNLKMMIDGTTSTRNSSLKLDGFNTI